jgi:Circularly permutated YpsA SLOG family/Domain of unknown function (DUF6794)
VIEKIVSGGQTGADRAGLDAAIDLDIPHGGWIPKGRRTEDGGLPEKYHLEEMPTGSYEARTEQNVIDSDGTLIVSHGKLNGGSAKTRRFAKKHNRPWLHVDLDKTNLFKAAMDIGSWVEKNRIKVLNVAGPRGSKDPEIYEATKKLLKAAFQLDLIQSSMPDPHYEAPHWPATVDEAVKELLSKLTLKDKTLIAKMGEDELTGLHPTLGAYIRERFGLWSGNKPLIESCLLESGEEISEDQASAVITRELWRRLKGTHKIRLVK